MASWRDLIATKGQKETIIRDQLHISAPKKSQEYRTAARQLQRIAKGEIKDPGKIKDARYGPVVSNLKVAHARQQAATVAPTVSHATSRPDTVQPSDVGRQVRLWGTFMINGQRERRNGSPFELYSVNVGQTFAEAWQNLFSSLVGYPVRLLQVDSVAIW